MAARSEISKPDGSVRREGAWLAPALAGSAAVLGAVAVGTYAKAVAAERRHPPRGRFMTVDGVRLHYLERGSGPPVVLFHGNGALVEDMLVSGLVGRLARRHRVIVFDRPGFGYSERPRTRIWTPQAQAELLWKALNRLGVGRAVVLGHSWGTLVALSVALEHPSFVASLVLVSGYYYPTVRLDVPLVTGPAIPVIGDVMRYTVAPATAAALLPRIYEKLFEPAPVPERFRREFPHALILRPWHLRAASADAALMIPAAAELQHRYRELSTPTVIVTGRDDQIVDVGRHARRFHGDLAGSALVEVPGAGHMVHHLAPDRIAEAVAKLSERESSRRLNRK
jgi:pimeloyl-ACP methyl ester carboxylesterase